jgi:hypothetical protein
MNFGRRRGLKEEKSVFQRFGLDLDGLIHYIQCMVEQHYSDSIEIGFGWTNPQN